MSSSGDSGATEREPRGPALDEGIPSLIDRYRIDALVGQGGMGRVYRAYDPKLRRPVALKVLHAKVPGASLLREARAAAALSHPHIVVVYDVSEWQGAPYLTMEWIDGARLRDFVSDSRVGLAPRLTWLCEIASALAAAHAAGFVHRDVKPENVMIAAGGSVRVLDFGLARAEGDDTSATTRDAAIAPGVVRIAGTPRYMAPEQLHGEPPTARSDQYAWGVVAYELLTGLHPAAACGARTPAEFAHTEPRPLAEVASQVPVQVAAAVHRAMAKAPLNRFPTMAEALAALAAGGGPTAAEVPAAQLQSLPTGPVNEGSTVTTGAGTHVFSAQGPPYAPVSPGVPYASTPAVAPRKGVPPWVIVAGSLLGIGGVVAVVLVFVLPLASEPAGSRAASSAGAGPRPVELPKATAEPTHSARGAGLSPSPRLAATTTPTVVPTGNGAPTSSATPAVTGSPTGTVKPAVTGAPTGTLPAIGSSCPPGQAQNKDGQCRVTCNHPSECGAAQVCIGNVCVDCPAGKYKGVANACFDVCGAGGSCVGKAWPGSVCTPYAGRQLCIPPGFQ